MAGERILIVDDEEVVCIALEKILEQGGYETESATSGREAVEKARNKKYDLVLIDLAMPEMDGIQTCKALKEISPDSVAVLFTGHVEKGLWEKEMEFMNSGGKVYSLYKPFSEEEILETARKALGSEKEPFEE